jgi:predicted nucleic acid-binding protein
MKMIFADTVYWVALFHPQDQWHNSALKASKENEECTIVTTDAVLSEVLNLFSSYGSQWRKIVAREIENLFSLQSIVIIPSNRELFIEGLALYQSRLDKEYSHTDCVSMVIMRREKITDVLSSDIHFSQEGFSLLLQ